MGLKVYAAALCALVIGVTAFAIPPADAQQPKQKQKKQYTSVTVRDANGRARTRVVVQPRDFLDAGTEVLPGERKFLDYAFPPGSGPGQGGPAVVTTFGNGRPGWDRWPSFNPYGPGWSGWP